jgi:hypothetical protein
MRSLKPANRRDFLGKLTGSAALMGAASLLNLMFCVCNLALTTQSAKIAISLNQDAETIKKEWIAGMIPDIALMPSGVWAVGRAQEHGCGYCYV